MCGRYELHSHPVAIALAFGLAVPPDLQPRYNIAPMTDVPVVRMGSHGVREIVRLRWGLVPRWAKDPSIGSRMINARAETLAEKHAFRIPYRRHRCLLPADGFYEWMAAPGLERRKQPVHIGMIDQHPFGLAGLHERWLSPSGEVVDTCAIVTTAANALLRLVHERMPLIVAPEDYARWLDPAHAEVDDLLRPFPAERMTCHPVSLRVNGVRNDDPTLIEPVAMGADDDLAQNDPVAHEPEQESLF